MSKLENRQRKRLLVDFTLGSVQEPGTEEVYPHWTGECLSLQISLIEKQLHGP